MLVEVRRESIRVFGNELQFSLQFPEHICLPTYGLRVEYPTTVAEIKQAIKEKAVEVKAQMEVNETVRQEFAEAIGSFEVEV